MSGRWPTNLGRRAGNLAARGERRRRWLFLTPEMERLAPGLLATLAPAAGASTTAEAEEARLDELVRTGAPADWFAELRRLRALLEAAAQGGGPEPLVHRLALILREQYLLAPGVLDAVPDGEAELDRLQALVHATAPSRA